MPSSNVDGSSSTLSVSIFWKLIQWTQTDNVEGASIHIHIGGGDAEEGAGRGDAREDGCRGDGRIFVHRDVDGSSITLSVSIFWKLLQWTQTDNVKGLPHSTLVEVLPRRWSR